VDVDGAAGALRAADAAARMSLRRHPVVMAAILSNFVVRAMEIAAAINRGRSGNLDDALIRALTRDLGRDLRRVREYARVRHLKLYVTVMRGPIIASTPGQGRRVRDLTLALLQRFHGALHWAGEFGQAVDETLARLLDLRLGLSRDEDLELACELAAGLEPDLNRVIVLIDSLLEARERILNGKRALAQIPDIDRSIDRALDRAFERCRALDRVCAQGVAGRLGISPMEGLTEALLDGAMDDFTSADLTYASLADPDLTGVRWSPSGTIWPPETDVKALLARSEKVGTGGGVLVVRRRGMAWPLRGSPG
jgi:hypothetical protein